ncbi:hypothetical protein M7I_5749 [Glarea lozoyensis 74030]|uniref:Uncharacterized protein n=1 Tax=Glarea lozoyensis (strain ATCC 74030 / MF5533) TaxID=1104152 RepID=H0ESQ6_GLAL7|nr:hypothetical protein M7I_5749 [Glarea lozoyensis 74030]
METRDHMRVCPWFAVSLMFLDLGFSRTIRLLNEIRFEVQWVLLLIVGDIDVPKFIRMYIYDDLRDAADI